jgi:phosphoglucosamine mutase
MTRQIFGTDGIRGRVGQAPITPDFVLKLGWAFGRVMAKKQPRQGSRCMVIIGKDTRISGYMFESALQAGLVAAGIDVSLVGPMPTPAVAYLTRTFHAQAGIVISASHNPYHDNGIKFFSSIGEKLEDGLEKEIESELEKPMTTVESRLLGKVVRINDAAGRYIEFCKGTVPRSFSLKGKNIVVDSAHGATYHVASDVLSELGAEVVTVGASPDGFNINSGVGSTDTATLQEVVLSHAADLGIAFDGDGDRVIFVDHLGDVVDGDELLFIIAQDRLKRTGNRSGVVGTQMTNLGMEQALKKLDIPFIRAKVGDRYVNAMMQAQGWQLGGESSGHIICADVTTTGDGLIAALQVLAALVTAEKTLSELKSGMNKLPQKMINVMVNSQKSLDQFPEIEDAVNRVEALLADRGRVLLRASGTEPVVRVMIEGNDGDEVSELCAQLAEEVAGFLS